MSMTFAQACWEEISSAPIGSTRILYDVQYEKMEVPWSDRPRWVSQQGRCLSNTAMYDATINP